jgi:hypothetical protein
MNAKLRLVSAILSLLALCNCSCNGKLPVVAPPIAISGQIRRHPAWEIPVPQAFNIPADHPDFQEVCKRIQPTQRMGRGHRGRDDELYAVLVLEYANEKPLKVNIWCGGKGPLGVSFNDERVFYYGTEGRGYADGATALYGLLLKHATPPELQSN